MILIVHHQQLCDAALVQQAHRLLLAHAGLHGGEIVVGHQFADRLGRVFGEAHVAVGEDRSEEHTSELQSLMRISYAVFCLKKKTKSITIQSHTNRITYSNT